jgi:hypothetical protein
MYPEIEISNSTMSIESFLCIEPVAINLVVAKGPR